MGIDRKYGRVTCEHGSIGEDEPVVVFRAQDALLPALLSMYIDLCKQAGSPTRHLAIIANSVVQVLEWQRANGCHVPNSESSRGRLES